MNTKWLELFFEFLAELCSGLDNEEPNYVADESIREIIDSLTEEQAFRLKKFFIKESEEALYELADNLNKGIRLELLTTLLKETGYFEKENVQ